MLMNNTKSINR